MSLKKIDNQIKRIVTNGQKLNMLIHSTAMLVVEHAKEHGDCTRALTLVKAMPASMRRTMLVLWFETFTPIRVVLTNDKVGILKSTAKGYVEWDLEAANEKPFFTLAEENAEEKTYDFAALVKMVERLSTTIENKVKDGKVSEADRPSAEKVVATLKALKFEPVKPANDANNVVLHPREAVNG